MRNASEIAVMTVSELHACQPGDEPVSVPVQVDMRWSGRDPLAVTLAFRTGRSGWVNWVVAVELVRAALLGSRPVGEGDVRMQRLTRDELRIELSSPTGSALFAFEAADVTALLERVDAACPPWEPLDPDALDTWLVHVLAAERR